MGTWTLSTGWWGTGHSIGDDPLVLTYAYVLPSGELDKGQSVDERRAQAEMEAEDVTLSVVKEGRVAVRYVGGPLAGTEDSMRQMANRRGD